MILDKPTIVAITRSKYAFLNRGLLLLLLLPLQRCFIIITNHHLCCIVSIFHFYIFYQYKVAIIKLFAVVCRFPTIIVVNCLLGFEVCNSTWELDLRASYYVSESTAPSVVPYISFSSVPVMYLI